MKKIILIWFFLVFSFFGCTDSKVLSPEDRISKIDLTVTGLNDPGDSTHYEAWIKWLDKTSTGDFEEFLYLGELAGSGNSYSLSKSINQGYIQGGLSIIVVMEPDSAVTDTAKEPGPYRIIGAELEANSGTFTVGSGDILDFDFTAATGMYILDTPTQNPPSLNPMSGVWFAMMDTTIEEQLDSLGNIIDRDTMVTVLPGLKLQNLTLSGLSAGWTYEGWVLFGDQWISTGQFKKTDAKDESSLYSGFQAAYNVPGEDFLRNAPAGLTFPTDLSGRNLKITLSPNYPAGANSPFTITLFQTQIPQSTNALQNYRLENVGADAPGGDLAVSVTLYN